MVAHLCIGEIYGDPARGSAFGKTTVYYYLREGLDVLAVPAPTLDQRHRRGGQRVRDARRDAAADRPGWDDPNGPALSGPCLKWALP